MKLVKYLPTEQLKPYIKSFVVSENELGNEYKVFPSTGLVIGLQYKGQLATLSGNSETALAGGFISKVNHTEAFDQGTNRRALIILSWVEP